MEVDSGSTAIKADVSHAMYSALAEALATNEKDVEEMKARYKDKFVVLGDQAEVWIQNHPGDMWTYEKGQLIIAQLGEATKPDEGKYYAACLLFKESFEVYAPSSIDMLTAVSGEPANNTDLPLERTIEDVVTKTAEDLQVLAPLTSDMLAAASGESASNTDLPPEKAIEEVVPKTAEEESGIAARQLWAPSLAGGAVVPAQVDMDDSWKQFETWKQMRQVDPIEINYEKCLARVWGNGAGSQCRHFPATGSVFCRMHHKNDAWQTHGRVDGPIPHDKLQEFMKASKRDAKPQKDPELTPREIKNTPTKRTASALVSSPLDAPKLKKPAGGAFGIYRAESIATIKASLLAKREESTLASMSKEAALLWKELPEEKKKSFENAYKAKKDAYKVAYKESDGGKKAKKAALVLPDGTPLKRPLNPYGLFLKDRRDSIKMSLPADHKMTDVGKEAGVLWKALPEDEKDAYREKFQAEHSSYKETALEVRKAQAVQEKTASVGTSVPHDQKRRVLRRRRKRAW